jgi:hypothetical protein
MNSTMTARTATAPDAERVHVDHAVAKRLGRWTTPRGQPASSMARPRRCAGARGDFLTAAGPGLTGPFPGPFRVGACSEP